MKKELKELYSKYRSAKSYTTDFLFGDRNYKKFVIISDSRTGSTLLMHLLNLHPQIITFGEEFKYLGDSSCSQVWNYIFRKRPGKINWVGFKLFYNHPVKVDDQEVWDFLEADRDIVIIHLTRKNLLRSYTSKQIGLKTKKWTENVKRPHIINGEEKKVILDFDECVKNFESIDGFIGRTEKRFKDHKIISVVYEELNKDMQSTIDPIYKELGVTDYKVTTNMKRQNPEPLQELVINYFEIKERFKNTRWAYLFQLKD